MPAFDDFGGGASVEYVRKEERKEALGIRAETSGARRAEARKEYTKGFMAMMMVVRTKGVRRKGVVSVEV
jgi:hypothetical protein